METHGAKEQIPFILYFQWKSIGIKNINPITFYTIGLKNLYT